MSPPKAPLPGVESSSPDSTAQQPPAAVEVPPATQIPCRNCGGMCYRTKVERLGLMAHTFGEWMLWLGYVLAALSLLILVADLILHFILWGFYGGPLGGFGPSAAAIEIMLSGLPLLVLGHLLALNRHVWMCTHCGSIFDRSNRPETEWAKRHEVAAEVKK